jgi:hypothetical protein
MSEGLIRVAHMCTGGFKNGHLRALVWLGFARRQGSGGFLRLNPSTRRICLHDLHVQTRVVKPEAFDLFLGFVSILVGNQE